MIGVYYEDRFSSLELFLCFLSVKNGRSVREIAKLTLRWSVGFSINVKTIARHTSGPADSNFFFFLNLCKCYIMKMILVPLYFSLTYGFASLNFIFLIP